MTLINTIQKQTKIINAILALSQLEQIPVKNIDKTFYKLKKEFPEYFHRLRFDTNWETPESEELNEIKNCLITSGKICFDGRKNYNLYLDKDDIKKLKKIPEIKLSVINDITKKFVEYIKK